MVVSAAASAADALLARAATAGVPATVAIDGRVVLDEPLDACERIWSTAIENLLQRGRAAAQHATAAQGFSPAGE